MPDQDRLKVCHGLQPHHHLEPVIPIGWLEQYNYPKHWALELYERRSELWVWANWRKGVMHYWRMHHKMINRAEVKTVGFNFRQSKFIYFPSQSGAIVTSFKLDFWPVRSKQTLTDNLDWLPSVYKIFSSYYPFMHRSIASHYSSL